MAENKNKKETGIESNKIVNKAVLLAVPVAIDFVKRKLYELASYVAVPDLCDSFYRHDLEKAEEKLASFGLKMMPFPMSIEMASPELRNCFDNQVLSTKPKAGTLVKTGRIIDVSYITQEVIDESKRMFEDAEKRKEEENEEETEDDVKQEITDESNKKPIKLYSKEYTVEPSKTNE